MSHEIKMKKREGGRGGLFVFTQWIKKKKENAQVFQVQMIRSGSDTDLKLVWAFWRKINK